MTDFDGYSGTTLYVQSDFSENAVVFPPAAIADACGAIPYLEAEASAQSFMQDQFRAGAMNMLDMGLVYSGIA